MAMKFSFLVLLKFICLLYSSGAFSQTMSNVELHLMPLSSAEKLIYLQSISSGFSDASTIEQAKYQHKLGMVLEENKQLTFALEAFSQAIELLSPATDSTRSMLVTALLERSYVNYLISYEIESYCPDRKLAVKLADGITDVDVKIRALVQYAFCFKENKMQLPKGLALLDDALVLAQENQLPANTLGMIYNASGNLYRSHQLYDQANESLSNAYEQWASVNDYQDMFNMLHGLVATSIERLELSQAQQHVDEMFQLAQQQPTFTDFIFFAYYNAGLLAEAKKQWQQAINHFKKAQEFQNNTQENFFIKQSYQQLILLYLRQNESEKILLAYEQLSRLFPEYGIENSGVLAAIAYANGDHAEVRSQFLRQLDHEIAERRLFLKHTLQVNTLLNRQNTNELDKKLLNQTIEIQQLQLKNQQAAQKQSFQLLVVSAIVLTVMLILIRYLLSHRRKFQKLARTDVLTGIANRRYILEKGELLFSQAKIKSDSLAVLLFDIDNFKLVNDGQGHHIGDQAINFIVQQTQSCLAKEYEFGRLGGDEFIIIAKGQTIDSAKALAEEIRAKIERNSQAFFIDFPVTISIGVVGSQGFENLSAVIAEADSMLYQAKNSGRNLVVCQS